MDPKLDAPDMLEVLDRVLNAALREVRAVRARMAVAEPGSPSEHEAGSRMSQTSCCVDILKTSGRPLHISALLAALRDRGVEASRESLVSAISKKLAPSGPFVRTAPNTFGLAGRDAQEA